MHAEEARGLRDGQGRVDRTGRDDGWQLRLVEEMSSPAPSLPSSQFLPIGRKSFGLSRARPAVVWRHRAPARSAAPAGVGAPPFLRGTVVGQADAGVVTSDRDDRDDGDDEDRDPGLADEARALAAAARVAADGRRASARPRAPPDQRSPTERRGSRRRVAPTPAQASPATIRSGARNEARRDEPRPVRVPPARIRIASSGSRVVRISGRPRPAVIVAAPPSPSSRGTPTTIAWSTAETCSMIARDRRRGARSAGARSPMSPATPADSRGHDDETVVERVAVDADRVEALVDLERDGLARVLERRPAATRTAASKRVRRSTSGRWSASSNESSASIRPLTRT